MLCFIAIRCAQGGCSGAVNNFIQSLRHTILLNKESWTNDWAGNKVELELEVR